jgi:hypothetical protein
MAAHFFVQMVPTPLKFYCNLPRKINSLSRGVPFVEACLMPL